GVLPVAFATELVLNGGVEAGAGQGVRHGHADVVRSAIAHHLEGALDVLAGFARIAELQEEADLDAGRVQPAGRLIDVVDLRALLHCVQDLLRAGFGANPDPLCTGPTQCV